MEFDFTKNAEVSDLSTVPEPYQGIYVEDTGEDGNPVYRIADNAKPLVDAYTGTAKSLNETRNHLKEANAESAKRRVTGKALTEFMTDLGIEEIDEENPINTLRGHIDDLVAKVEGGKDIKINMDKIKAEHDRRVQEVAENADQKVQKMQGALERYLVDQAATAALADAKGSVRLLLPHVKAHTRVVQDGEDYVVRVVDAQGDFRSDGKGGFMTVADLVTEMKTQEEFGRAFESATPGGNGAPPGGGGGRMPRREEPKSSIDKISAGLQRGGTRR